MESEVKTISLLLSILVILSACGQPSVDHADKIYIDGNFFGFFVLVTAFAPLTLAEGESPAKTGKQSRA